MYAPIDRSAHHFFFKNYPPILFEEFFIRYVRTGDYNGGTKSSISEIWISGIIQINSVI